MKKSKSFILFEDDDVKIKCAIDILGNVTHKNIIIYKASVVEYYRENKKRITEYGAEWRLQNKDRIVKYGIEYRGENKKRIAKQKSEYYHENKEHIAKYEAEWRLQNKDHIAEYQAEYRQENKDYIAKRSAEYYNTHKIRITKRAIEWRSRNKDYIVEYRQKNKDHIAEYQAEYKQENKERLVKYDTEYRQKNKDHIAEQKTEYWHENKERITERIAEWRLQNKDKVHIYNAHTRAERHSWGPPIPINKWFEGSNLHHMHIDSDRQICMYIPEELHKSIWHSSKDIETMEAINKVVWDWYLNDAENKLDIIKELESEDDTTPLIVELIPEIKKITKLFENEE